MYHVARGYFNSPLTISPFAFIWLLGGCTYGVFFVIFPQFYAGSLCPLCGMLSRFPSCILATFLSPLATLSISWQSYCHFVYYVRMVFGHLLFVLFPQLYAGSLRPLFRHRMPAILASMPRAPLRDSSFFLCRRIKSADQKRATHPSAALLFLHRPLCGMLSRFPSCILATLLSPLATLSISGQSHCHFVYYVRMVFGHPSFSIIPASYAVFFVLFPQFYAGSLCPLSRYLKPANLASMPRALLRNLSFFLCRRI